jgi:phosphatidylglycerophosphate synthase
LTARTFPGIQNLVAANVLNPLTIFGLFAVTAMLVCYALEKRSHWFVLGFALACVLGSLYGFLQGAWPFGLIEFIWALIALRRWRTSGRTDHG